VCIVESGGVQCLVHVGGNGGKAVGVVIIGIGGIDIFGISGIVCPGVAVSDWQMQLAISSR